MRDYGRERRLVKEREGIEFATDVWEAAQMSMFEGLDTVHRNPLQVSFYFFFFFFWSVCLHTCFPARQLFLLGFKCRIKYLL